MFWSFYLGTLFLRKGSRINHKMAYTTHIFSRDWIIICTNDAAINLSPLLINLLFCRHRWYTYYGEIIHGYSVGMRTTGNTSCDGNLSRGSWYPYSTLQVQTTQLTQLIIPSQSPPQSTHLGAGSTLVPWSKGEEVVPKNDRRKIIVVLSIIFFWYGIFYLYLFFNFLVFMTIYFSLEWYTFFIQHIICLIYLLLLTYVALRRTPNLLLALKFAHRSSFVGYNTIQWLKNEPVGSCNYPFVNHVWQYIKSLELKSCHFFHFTFYTIHLCSSTPVLTWNIKNIPVCLY